jgi:hypothetical protein
MIISYPKNLPGYKHVNWCNYCTSSGMQPLRKRKNPGKTGVPVPKEGFEPSWKYIHYALNVARLPIPPLRHALKAEDILPEKPNLSTSPVL